MTQKSLHSYKAVFKSAQFGDYSHITGPALTQKHFDTSQLSQSKRHS